jgi:hypothetical protein
MPYLKFSDTLKSEISTLTPAKAAKVAKVEPASQVERRLRRPHNNCPSETLAG